MRIKSIFKTIIAALGCFGWLSLILTLFYGFTVDTTFQECGPVNIYTQDGNIEGPRFVTIDNTFTLFDNGLSENILNWDGASWTIHADDVIAFEASDYCFDNVTGQVPQTLAGFTAQGCLVQANFEKQTAQECRVIAYAFVNANGSIQNEFGGITATRLSPGRYQYSGPPGTEFFEVTVVESFATRDDIQAYPESFFGNLHYLAEQDNGGGAGTLVDRPHRVFAKAVVTDLIDVNLTQP